MIPITKPMLGKAESSRRIILSGWISKGPEVAAFEKEFSDTKSTDLLGYTPSITLSDGLGRLRDWYSSLSNSPEELLKKEWVRNWHRQEKIAINHRNC